MPTLLRPFLVIPLLLATPLGGPAGTQDPDDGLPAEIACTILRSHFETIEAIRRQLDDDFEDIAITEISHLCRTGRFYAYHGQAMFESHNWAWGQEWVSYEDMTYAETGLTRFLEAHEEIRGLLESLRRARESEAGWDVQRPILEQLDGWYTRQVFSPLGGDGRIPVEPTPTVRVIPGDVLHFGEPFVVELAFDIEPDESSWTVKVACLGRTLSVVTRRTSDPLVFRSEPIELDPPAPLTNAPTSTTRE